MLNHITSNPHFVSSSKGENIIHNKVQPEKTHTKFRKISGIEQLESLRLLQIVYL